MGEAPVGVLRFRPGKGSEGPIPHDPTSSPNVYKLLQLMGDEVKRNVTFTVRHTG